MNASTYQQRDRVIRLPEVIEITGLSRSSIYSFMKQDLFPKQRSIGPRAVGWLESEVLAWVNKYFGNE